MDGKYLIKNKSVAVAESKIVVGEKALVAQSDLPKNTAVFLYQDSATALRTRTSIQVSHEKHIEPGEFGAFANHSCSPNTQIIANYDEATNVADVLMLTIKPVAAGEELTFDYATTETTVTDNLLYKPCLCGAEQCRKIITGFEELPLAEKMRLMVGGHVANYLQIND